MTATEQFELQNVGAGQTTFSLSAAADEHDFVLLLFQRDHLCTNCREQVQTVGDAYESFKDRGCEVVSIVPEPVEKVRKWQESYDLPFPLLADPDKRVSGDFDQPVRFGPLGRLSDFFGRMPKAVLLDCRSGKPTIAYTHEGSSTWDRPEVDDLLAAIDDLRADETE